jgi:hypothetical protein
MHRSGRSAALNFRNHFGGHWVMVGLTWILYPDEEKCVTGVNLTLGELELLIDGLSGDVDLVWVLIHLGIRSNPPPTPDWAPAASDLQDAFASLQKLNSHGLIRVGRIEYADGGPPGRLAPVRHIAEDMDSVVSRVEAAVRTACVEDDWAYSCWVVNTDDGNVIARAALDRLPDGGGKRNPG